MHLYLITRGIKNCVDRFINELSAKYVKFNIEKDGTAGLKKKEYYAQVSVRPIQLWEIVFPEKHKDLMLNTIFKGSKGGTQHKKHNKFITALRKILGCSKIPEYNKDYFLPIYLDNVEKVGIGIKKDRYENGTEML